MKKLSPVVYIPALLRFHPEFISAPKDEKQSLLVMNFVGISCITVTKRCTVLHVVLCPLHTQGKKTLKHFYAS